MRQKTYYEAYLDDFDKITVFLSKDSYGGVSNRFHLRDQSGHIRNLVISSIEQTQNNYNKYTLHLSESITIGEEYEVVHQFARATILEYGAIVKTEHFDELFFYDGDDLGAVYAKERTAFALWAPTAVRVKVEISKDGAVSDYEMTRSDRGVFRLTVNKDLENASYVYLVRVNGAWREAIDPYGIASTVNSQRSVIVDRSKIRVKPSNLPLMKDCDAILYEANVRDFTIQRGIGVNHPGTFCGFCEENETTKEKQTGFSYLKSLGVTHVQLMPVMDYGSVDEADPKRFYNWGYDPVQWRCLEGSLANDVTNPYARIFEFIKLIETCHENGIRVNLDVVFNHVYDRERNALDLIVPNYYFQMNENGDFSNGTYCGNDVDSTRRMCRKLIVDTCVFLCRTYRIDGFRFDLMGILDINTMNEIVDRCRLIHPGFMVYGEGWNMPSFLDQSRRACIANQVQMPEIAHFSDRFRDVTKGNTSEYEINAKGYCSGAVYLIDHMKNVLAASCLDVGDQPMFQNPKNAVNYVECHDNHTCWDKLRECCKEDAREIRIQRMKMCNAAVLLAQGIPFLHSGQEFARTKHGKSNTYNDSDEINQIDYARRDRYQELVDSTKALIRIRKNHPCFRYSDTKTMWEHISFADIDRKVLIYQLHDEHEDVMVFFNPTTEEFSYHLPYAYELLYYNAGVQNESLQDVKIAGVSTIVLAHCNDSSRTDSDI